MQVTRVAAPPPVCSQFWPCGLTWLGVGTAYYRAGDYLHAEQALNEANILNNLDQVGGLKQGILSK